MSLFWASFGIIGGGMRRDVAGCTMSWSRYEEVGYLSTVVG